MTPMSYQARPMTPKRYGSGAMSPGIKFAIFIAFFTLPAALLAPSSGVVLAAGFSLAIIVALLWRSSEPPILLFPAAYQWSEVAMKPTLSAIYGVPVNTLSESGGNIEAAAYFGLSAIIMLSLGMRLGAKSPSKNWNTLLYQETASLPFGKIFSICLAMLLVGQFFIILSVFISPLRQVLLAMSTLGLVGLFAFSYWCLKNRRGYFTLAVVMVLQIVVGMTGFFADFKAPILMFCIAAQSARGKLKDAFVVILAAALLIGLGAFWSEVKMDYRKFVNLGSDQQTVSVPLDQRLQYMGDQISTFNSQRFSKGLDLLFKRHSYIDFLSHTMDHVPKFLPHEGGARLGKVALHLVTPRVLFPNKPETEFDTEVTAKYTGLPMLIRLSTSISIGYLGEAYIDFGYFGSLIFCLIGGVLFGKAYRYLIEGSKGPLLLRFGLCAVMAISLGNFGTALIKLVGGIVTGFIGAIILQKFVFPHLVRFIKWPRLRAPSLPPGAMSKAAR